MRSSDRGDAGAALVLALIFIFAIGLVLVAITNFAGSAATSTYNLRAIRSSELSAENAVTNLIGQARANPSVCTAAGSNPTPQVYCTQTTYAFSLETRIVDVYSCPGATSSLQCQPTRQGMLVHATVTFDDVPPDNPSAAQCSGVSVSTCGVSVAVTTWDVRSADT